MSRMSREEFESWIEDDAHISEAIDRLPTTSRTIEQWLKLFALSLNAVAKEESKEAEEEDDSLSEELDDGLDTDDDEDDGKEEEEPEED